MQETLRYLKIVLNLVDQPVVLTSPWSERDPQVSLKNLRLFCGVGNVHGCVPSTRPKKF